MNKTKILTFSYFFILIIGVGILFRILLNINYLLNNNLVINSIKEYSALQTKAGIQSIVIFVILLVVSFIIYFLTKRHNYILLSNIIYISFTLYIYITANKDFYVSQDIDYSQQGEYWLTVFMGVFYILGSILVSSIGYITIRNYTKNSRRQLNHNI